VSVMIGVDPHKGSHTAAAIDGAEMALGQVTVRANDSQLERLLGWAGQWPERAWAIENATGLGYLLAQQLVAAGERVLDVAPKLAARVRLLNSGDTNKNDPNDARSVAIAALRSPAVREVAAEDHTEVMKIWAKRHRDLGSARTRVVCRLHAVLCELVAGGVSKAITAKRAAELLESVEAGDAIAAARVELAGEYLADLIRIDGQLKDTNRRMAVAVKASRSTLTDIYGVGPYVAAITLGEVGDVGRFANRDHFASYNGTAPIDVSSGPRKIHRLSRRGNRRINHAIHMTAVTQVRHRATPGRDYYDRKIAEGKTRKEALRALKRRISDIIYATMVADARAANTPVKTGPGGQTGNDSAPSATGSHPATPALRKSHSRTTTNTTSPRSRPTANRKISRRAS